MAKYVVLYKMTDQGAKNISSLPERVREARAQAESQGVTVHAWYLTEGQYDVVTVVEAADERVVVAGLLAIARNGNFHTETLRAFDENEAAQIIGRI
jgi:uncharacterized protein with GYD domain